MIGTDVLENEDLPLELSHGYTKLSGGGQHGSTEVIRTSGRRRIRLVDNDHALADGGAPHALQRERDALSGLGGLHGGPGMLVSPACFDNGHSTHRLR